MAAPGIFTHAKNVLTNLRLGMGLAWAASSRSLITNSLLGVFSAAMPPLSVYLGASLVDTIVDARTDSMRWTSILHIIGGLWVATGVQRAVAAYMSYGRNIFGRRVQLEAERRLLAHAATLDLTCFEDPQWHDRLARAKRDISSRPSELTWAVLGLLGNLVTIVLMAGLLVSLHYGLVLLAVTSALLSLFLERRVTAQLYGFFYQETPEARERDYLADLVVQPRLAKEIRAYVLSDYLLERHARLSDQLFRRREDLYRSGARVSIGTGLVTGTALALAYLFVANLGVSGAIDPGGVVLVIGAFASISQTLTQVSNTLTAIDQHTTFLQDYFSFLGLEPAIRISQHPRELAPGPISGIEFDDVFFTYPSSGKPALSGLTLHIRRGELIALVGENGAGKSTLVKLLLRFYDADRGSVRLGGIDVRDLNPSALRNRIGVLFQDYGSYELTIRENVALGKPGDGGGDERIVAALRKAHSDWLLTKMDKGLDSRVGRLFEGGHDLSGGEWQRLALARLMYRDADVWILDEPTSSLDPEAEAAMFSRLKSVLRNRIGIVISHRFSSVRLADRIAVIADGRVAEFGTHQELIGAMGRYSHLYELQAAGYR
jgi:ATP-binding cassette subfamily B protein